MMRPGRRRCSSPATATSTMASCSPRSGRSTPAPRRSGLAFAGVFAHTFCGLVAVGAVLPVLPGYVKGKLGYGDFAVGVVIGCYAVSGLLLRPVAGRLADRRGRKWTALGGSLL